MKISRVTLGQARATLCSPLPPDTGQCLQTFLVAMTGGGRRVLSAQWGDQRSWSASYKAQGSTHAEELPGHKRLQCRGWERRAKWSRGRQDRTQEGWQLSSSWPPITAHPRAISSLGWIHSHYAHSFLALSLCWTLNAKPVHNESTVVKNSYHLLTVYYCVCADRY